jgi:predicted PurR-regulated permease PerM
VAVPSAIIPSLGDQVSGLTVDIQRFLQSVENALDHSFLVAGQVVEVGVLYRQFVGSLQGILEPLFGQTLGLAVDVLTSFVWIIFIFVVSFYLIKDGPALRDWMENVVPPVYREDYSRLRNEISLIWAAFFRGQLVLALVVMLMFTVIGFALGLPFALAMAVFAGLMEFLPSVGHAIWLFVASILAFFLGSLWIPLPNWAFMLLVIGLHLVFEQFDLNYLIPRIIGRRVHLPPLVVILGIVTGAVLAGVLGILLAAPTIASARVLGRYVYANLFDLEPFPDSISQPLPAPNPRWWRRILENLGQRFSRSK